MPRRDHHKSNQAKLQFKFRFPVKQQKAGNGAVKARCLHAHHTTCRKRGSREAQHQANVLVFSSEYHGLALFQLPSVGYFDPFRPRRPSRRPEESRPLVREAIGVCMFPDGPPVPNVSGLVQPSKQVGPTLYHSKHLPGPTQSFPYSWSILLLTTASSMYTPSVALLIVSPGVTVFGASSNHHQSTLR